MNSLQFAANLNLHLPVPEMKQPCTDSAYTFPEVVLNFFLKFFWFEVGRFCSEVVNFPEPVELWEPLSFELRTLFLTVRHRLLEMQWGVPRALTTQNLSF